MIIFSWNNNYFCNDDNDKNFNIVYNKTIINVYYNTIQLILPWKVAIYFFVSSSMRMSPQERESNSNKLKRFLLGMNPLRE